jgi:hypothetical protein
MNHTLQIGKKAFTWSVVVLTILWSMGIAALVPLVAKAETCPSLSAGDLFKVPGNSAVYLLNANMQRLYFSHSTVYKTWYTDFSGVVEIPSTCVDAYPAPSVAPFGVNVRPGAKLVKVTISPSVYAVEPGNKLSKVGSEQVAKDLYGTDWAKQVLDVADPFWPNYANRGSDITESIPHNGQLLKSASNATVYFVKDGSKYMVDGTVRGDVRTVSQAVLDKVATGSGSVTAASVYDNPSQGSGSASSVPPAAAGSVTISVAGDTPSGTYALGSAARVPFTKLVFTAGASDVTITSFKVARGGSPAVNGDFSAINVVDPAGNLLNDLGKTPNSDNLVTFTEDIKIPANTSKTYTLVGDMVANATLGNGNQPKLGLYSVETSASVNATLPLYGNAVMTNNNITLGTVTLAEGLTVGTVTKQVGTDNVQVASVKVTVATNDFQVERIVLNNSGTTASDDIKNFKLKYNNNVIANGTMTDKYLTFDLSACTSDCKILKGNDRTFDVYGDIVGGSGRNINLDVQRTVHVLAKDLKNSVYVTPTNNASGMTNTVTVSQGKVNVTKTNDVATGDVPENASGVKLATFNFKVTGEPIDVRTLVFKLVTGSSTIVPTGFDAITLYDASGKALIGGVDATGAASPGYATTTDTFTLAVGDNILTVKANIDTTAANNDTVHVDIDMSNTDNFSAKGVNSGETITLGTYSTPNSVVTGNTMTIKTSALRITQLPTPPTTTYAAGTSDVLLAEILLDAGGSSEDLKVTQFKTKDFADGGAKTIDVQNIRLFVDKDGDSYNGSGSQVALSEVQNGSDSTAANDEAFTFNLSGDDQFVVKAGKKLVVSIKGSLTGGAATGNHVFRTNAANDVTANGVSTNTTVSETVDTAPQGSTVSVGAAGGTVQVGVDSSSPDAKLLAAGSQGATLAVFNFYATTTEDVEIDALYLTQRVTVTASAAFQDYDLLYLVDEAGVTVGSMVPTSTKPFIDLNSGAFVVKKDDNDGAKLYLKANLSSIGPSLNVTVGGHALGFSIAAAGDVTAKGKNTGTGSVEYLASGSEAPTGNIHYMHKGVPTFEKLALPSGTLVNGSNTLFKFKVTANTADIGLWKFTFDVTTTGAQITSLELYDVTESAEVLLYSSSTIANWTSTNAVMAEVLLDDDNPTANDGGEERTVSVSKARTFELRGTVSGAASGDSISTRMGGDSAQLSQAGANAPMVSATTVNGDSHNDFIWSDRNASGHSTSTNDWINGYLVNGLSSASTSAAVLSL